MRLGLHGLGIGAGAERAVIDAVASAATGVDAVRERVRKLEQLGAESGRDRGELLLAVSLRSSQVGDVEVLTELGIGELVLAQVPPGDPDYPAG